MAKRLLLLAPFIVFAALAVVFAWRVTDGADRSVVPSALIDRAVPETTFPPLRNAGITPDDFSGKVTLVNVFASWCAPCRVEHPILMALSETEGLTIVGINYKDSTRPAEEFLAELGDPYDAIGVDMDGRKSIEWGVYGVPETFLVDREARIIAKHVGVLSPEVLEGAFGEALRAALASEAGPAAAS